MKVKFTILAAMLILLNLVSCAGRGTYVPVSEAHDDFNVVRLFSTEGTTVYRFYDNGNYHYFTIDSNGNSDYLVDVKSNGKSKHYE